MNNSFIELSGTAEIDTLTIAGRFDLSVLHYYTPGPIRISGAFSGSVGINLYMTGGNPVGNFDTVPLVTEYWTDTRSNIINAMNDITLTESILSRFTLGVFRANALTMSAAASAPITPGFKLELTGAGPNNQARLVSAD
jgi:hypothetical protein